MCIARFDIQPFVEMVSWIYFMWLIICWSIFLRISVGIWTLVNMSLITKVGVPINTQLHSSADIIDEFFSDLRVLASFSQLPRWKSLFPRQGFSIKGLFILPYQVEGIIHFPKFAFRSSIDTDHCHFSWTYVERLGNDNIVKFMIHWIMVVYNPDFFSGWSIIILRRK